MGKSQKITTLGTVRAFFGKGCSVGVMHALDRAFGEPLPREEAATVPHMGGIMQHGYQCGMLWGAALAAGAQAYRLHGAGACAEASAVSAAQGIIASFRANNKDVNCLELTGIGPSSSNMHLLVHFLFKGGTVTCVRRATRFTPAAFAAIEAALAEPQRDAPAGPTSCAAELAKRMGASDLHAVMAAGLAGGIGLSGGACGALGAAIWLMGLNTLEAGATKVAYKLPEASEAIERFLKCSDYELECASIVGRKFESVADHACHVGAGGCAKIIDVLAELGVRSKRAA